MRKRAQISQPPCSGKPSKQTHHVGLALGGRGGDRRLDQTGLQVEILGEESPSRIRYRVFARRRARLLP